MNLLGLVALSESALDELADRVVVKLIERGLDVRTGEPQAPQVATESMVAALASELNLSELVR